MIRLALIGKDIKHSRSKEIYEKILNSKFSYDLIDCKSEQTLPDVQSLFKHYDGVSVTSPYKKSFINHVNVMPNFRSLRAINCIRKKDGLYQAINSDYLAVVKILTGLECLKFKCKVVVLGDGVMSQITQQALVNLSIGFKVYSRKKDGDISNLDFLSINSIPGNRLLVINSCSRDFVFRGILPDKAVFWDQNYNFLPHQEKFQTEEVNYVDGLNLLKLQAIEAIKFWGIT